MTRAFRTNLTALSLLALLTGAFLIYNAMTVSVLQRRDLISTLRTLGVGRGEVLRCPLPGRHIGNRQSESQTFVQ